MKYDYNLNRPHIPFNVIDDKLAYMINCMLSCSMWDIFEFNKKVDVNILEDDSLERHIEIDEDQEVEQGNALVYNILNQDEEVNFFKYDRLVIHHSIGKIYSYWAIDFINTETGHYICFDTIDYSLNELIQHVKSIWYSFKFQNKYEKIKEFHKEINFTPGKALLPKISEY